MSKHSLFQPVLSPCTLTLGWKSRLLFLNASISHLVATPLVHLLGGSKPNRISDTNEKQGINRKERKGPIRKVIGWLLLVGLAIGLLVWYFQPPSPRIEGVLLWGCQTHLPEGWGVGFKGIQIGVGGLYRKELIQTGSLCCVYQAPRGYSYIVLPTSSPLIAVIAICRDGKSPSQCLWKIYSVKKGLGDTLTLPWGQVEGVLWDRKICFLSYQGVLYKGVFRKVPSGWKVVGLERVANWARNGRLVVSPNGEYCAITDPESPPFGSIRVFRIGETLEHLCYLEGGRALFARQGGSLTFFYQRGEVVWRCSVEGRNQQRVVSLREGEEIVACSPDGVFLVTQFRSFDFKRVLPEVTFFQVRRAANGVVVSRVSAGWGCGGVVWLDRE